MCRLVQAAAGRLCRLCRQGSNHLGRLDANVLIQLRVRQGQLHRLLNLLDLQGGQEKTTDGAMQAMWSGWNWTILSIPCSVLGGLALLPWSQQFACLEQH